MARLRVPAGVYVRGVAIGGRFVDTAQLVAYARQSDITGASLIGDMLERAARRAGRSRRAELERAVNRIVRVVERKATPRVRRPSVPPAAPEIPEVPEVPEYEDIDTEWEFGVSYAAAGYRTSNVDVNIRVAREDGGMMTRSEAANVFAEFRHAVAMKHDAQLPAGYRFAAINWRRPTQHGEWRGGYGESVHKLWPLLYPLIEVAGDVMEWRFNRVDESDTGI